MSTPKPTHLGRQVPVWVTITELEMAPSSWGRPVRENDARSIAYNFDPDRLGALAVWYRPDLAIQRGRYVLLDGQHRLAALHLMKWDEGLVQQAPCLLYEGLTMERAAELSLGLQERRNLHALDKHRAGLVAHDRRAVDIDKVLSYCHLELVYTTKPTDRERLSAVGTCYQVWDRMGHSGLERVLTVCGRAWDQTSQGFCADILRLVMTVMCAHDGQVDDRHLAETLSVRSPGQWVSKGMVPHRSLASVAQDVIVEYNKKARGSHRLSELTQSEYTLSAKRPASPTIRGHIEAKATTGHTIRKMNANRPTAPEEKESGPD